MSHCFTTNTFVPLICLFIPVIDSGGKFQLHVFKQSTLFSDCTGSKQINEWLVGLKFNFTCKVLRVVGGAYYRGSFLASHPAAPGSNPGSWRKLWLWVCFPWKSTSWGINWTNHCSLSVTDAYNIFSQYLALISAFAHSVFRSQSELIKPDSPQAAQLGILLTFHIISQRCTSFWGTCSRHSMNYYGGKVRQVREKEERKRERKKKRKKTALRTAGIESSTLLSLVRVFYRCAIIAFLHIPTDGVARIFYKFSAT